MSFPGKFHFRSSLNYLSTSSIIKSNYLRLIAVLNLPILQNLNCNPFPSVFPMFSLVVWFLNLMYVPYIFIVVDKKQFFRPFCINSMKYVQTNMIRAISCLNLNNISSHGYWDKVEKTIFILLFSHMNMLRHSHRCYSFP